MNKAKTKNKSLDEHVKEVLPPGIHRRLEALMFPDERVASFLERVVDMLPPSACDWSSTPIVFNNHHANQIALLTAAHEALQDEVRSLRDAVSSIGTNP